jgi:DNA-binding transcriptional LysR family regulator
MSYYNFLESFRITYETGSVTKAAVRLNYAQSTVTKHIQALEEKTRKELFIREGRNFKPTLFADELYHTINAYFSNVDKIINKVCTGDVNVPKLTILSSPDYYRRYIIPKILESTLKGFTYRLLFDDSLFLRCDDINLIDIAIHSRIINGDNLITQKLPSQKIVFVGQKKWVEKIKGKSISEETMSFYNDLPWVGYGENVPWITKYFAQYNISPINPRIVLAVNDEHVVLDAVLSGVCVGILSFDLCQPFIESNDLYILDNNTEMEQSLPMHFSYSCENPRIPFIQDVLQMIKK